MLIHSDTGDCANLSVGLPACGLNAFEPLHELELNHY